MPFSCFTSTYCATGTGKRTASGITYTVNDKQCSESEYNEALQQLVQKISFTDINFETMGRSESPRDSIKGYHQAEK